MTDPERSHTINQVSTFVGVLVAVVVGYPFLCGILADLVNVGCVYHIFPAFGIEAEYTVAMGIMILVIGIFCGWLWRRSKALAMCVTGISLLWTVVLILYLVYVAPFALGPGSFE